MASSRSQYLSDSVGESGLPDFAHPPVDETALSIQFAPIPRFSVPHFGLLWARLRSDYPRFEVHQPITNVTEQLGTKVVAGRQLGIELLELPEVRCWFVDESGNRLVQVQRDRLVHNWRKVTGTETYPRYPVVRSSLEKEWDRFCGFLRDEGFDQPKVNQCEVTYVNNIEYEKGWNGYGELDKVIAALSTPKPTNRFLPDPERISMQVTYRLEGNAGRLYVSFIPVIRGRDGKEVLQMTLTARGAPVSSNVTDVLSWLDLGRKWIVKGFADFTTENMHNVWGKK